MFQEEKRITAVSIINDRITIYEDNKHLVTLVYPQALALHTHEELILLDKEVWFSEMIAIKRGRTIEELLYVDSVNWQDDPEEYPSVHFEFQTEIIEVG